MVKFLVTLSGLVGLAVAATPKLLICSDSTTCNYDASSVLQGWGYYAQDYFSGLTVVNLAKAGRSTRSFIAEGLWDALLAQTSAGDYVMIEMGKNDDGDPLTDTATRATLPGIGNNSEVAPAENGGTETVYSFGWYLRKMIADVRAKNAIPILSGMTPRNYWNSTTVIRTYWPFAIYAQQVAQQTAVEYIDHTQYSADRWREMGETTAKTYFPNDNTHTNWPGARIVAEGFVQAVKYHCSTTSQLKKYLNSNGTSVTDPPQRSC